MTDASIGALRRRRAADTKQTTHNITKSTTSGSASPVGTSRRASAVSAPAAVVTSARTGTVYVDPPTRHRTAAAAPFVLPPSPKPQSARDAAAERRAEIERQQRKRAPPGVYEQLDDVPRYVAARASLSLPAKSVATPNTSNTSNTTTSSGGSTATHPHSISVTAPTSHSTNAPSREAPERSRAAQPPQPASPAASRTFLVNADVDQDADPAAAARGPTKEQLAHVAADVQQQLGQPRYVAMTARQAAAEEHWRQSHNYAQLVRGLHERLGIVTPQPAQPTLSPRSEARRLALPKPMHVVADVTDKVVALRRAEMAEMTARVRRMLADAAIVGVPVIPLVSVESSGVPCPACQYCIELTSEATIRTYLVPVLQTVVSERVVVPMAGRRGFISVQSSAVSESAETIDAFPVHQSSRAPSTADPGPARYSVPRSFRVEVVPFGLHKVSVHVSVHTSLVEHFYRAHAREQEHRLSLAIDPPFPEEWAAWTDADKQRLLHRVLDERLHAGANPIVPVAEKTVVMYPAHVDAMRDALWATAWSARSLMGWLTIPEDAVAGYLGPEVMLYYAWMNHYARWLLGAGLLGVLVLLLGSLRLAPDAAAAAVMAAPLDGAAWTADGAPVLVPAVSHVMRLRRAVQYGLDVALLPGFSATMLVGSVLCIKMWERRCSALSMKYRLFQQEGKDEPRHDFRGTPGTDPVTGEPQLTYPAWYRAMVLQPLAWAVVALFMAGTLGLMVCSLNLDGMVSDPASHLAIPVLRRLTEDGRLLDKSVHPVAAMLPQLVYSVLIAALSFVFTALVKFLTRLENYRCRGEYVRALTLKRVAFEFVNSYAKLFFIAFGRGSMTELASNLQSILYVAVLSRLMSDTVVPFVMTHRRRVMRQLFRATSASTTSSPTAGSGSTRAPREVGPVNVHGGSSASPLDEVDEMFDPYDIYMDSIEMMIQFGYLLLFAAAYPLASFVALLSNIIEVRSNLFKMCYVVRRPVPRLGVQQNATWCGVMRGFAMAAMITNTFLLAFTSHQMERWFPDYFAAPRGAGDKTTAAAMAATLNRSLRLDAAGLEMVPGKGRYVVLYSMVMEHVMGLIAVFLFWRIPSTPRDVRHYRSRKMFERMSRA